MRYAVVLTAGFFTVGCAAQGTRPADTDAAARALTVKDYDTAISRADSALNRKPTGAALAETQYIKGRALEDKLAQNDAESKQNLQAARTAYIAALDAKPARPLEGLIRASLADVAYWQDDYNTAANQWIAAVPLLEDRDVAAWSLYRVAVSRQRLGQFIDADRVFAQVMKDFADSEPAQRAAEKTGKRNFVVQVATFAQPATADRCVRELQALRLPVQKQLDAQSRTVVTIGAFGRYTDAASARTKVVGTYPDAVVVP